MSSERGRLLVVDDVEANRDLLARRLRQLGHSVTSAASGRGALELVETHEFDLILLDIMMPEMDGYEVLARLQANPERKHIPIIMISAVDEIESVVRCVELGATDYLPKPFNAVLLKARVHATLEKKRLRDREQLHARSLEREMEIGRQIQASFLPEKLPSPEGWEVAAFFRPARQVAGDFYDAFTLASGRIGLVIADVCDKGVGAALFMALFRTLIRASSELAEPALSGMTDAAERAAARVTNAVAWTNDYIARTHGDSNMFATLFFAVLDPKTGLLTYINGGHEPPILLTAQGSASRLPPSGPAVGLLPGQRFEVRRAQMSPGDLFLGFTDGVTESRSPSHQDFGEDRLLALLDPFPISASSLLARIDGALAAHAAGEESFDDVTMLAVRRRA
ncbi:MAG: SpoIIE family protein phosphatase [Acidobacteria bacterium]|nr:SpoIIE family protein phosphatase [Acidobacteriota bacterium]MCA1610610.1 SpoIIE family protein phosphatase [Acidobacteriota bacterium]